MRGPNAGNIHRKKYKHFTYGKSRTDSKTYSSTHLVHTVALPYHCTINSILQRPEGTEGK